MLWVAVLASDNQNANAFSVLPIDNGIGQALQWLNPSDFVGRSAKARKFNQQIDYTVELVKEPAG